MSNFKKIVLPFLLLCSLGTLAISMVFLWTSGIALDEMICVTEYFDSMGCCTGFCAYLYPFIAFLYHTACGWKQVRSEVKEFNC